jgi:uncharacterized protein YndB with AHSA1/START domain/flagellar motility protein MotE (MotC chaperone)
MEGGLAICGFWIFMIALVMKKPLMAFIEKSKQGGASNAQVLQRLQQLESLSQTMAKDLAEIRQLLQAQSTDNELLKLKEGMDEETDVRLIESEATNLGTIVDSKTIRFERILPGSVETVWKYLSDPEYLAEWLATTSLQPSVGGRIEFDFDASEASEIDQGSKIRGLISSFDAPKSLAYSWIDTQTALESRLSFELSPHGDGDETMLVLTHMRLPEDKLANFLAAWHARLGALIARLKDLAPPSFSKTYQRLLPVYAALALTIVVSAAPANAALSGESSHIIQTERTHLLTKYDNHWRDADELEREIVRLRHENSASEDQTIDRLDKKLKDEYRDLHQIELDIRELDKALL